jgi:hypothetical protein
MLAGRRGAGEGWFRPGRFMPDLARWRVASLSSHYDPFGMRFSVLFAKVSMCAPSGGMFVVGISSGMTDQRYQGRGGARGFRIARQ